MRERNRREGWRVAVRRPAAAWLTLAALLSLALSQPFHAASAGRAAHAGSESVLVAAQNGLGAPQAGHDADQCSLCRATAQARLGVRVSACAGDFAAIAACLPLALPAPELAASSPDLRTAAPRAPPLLRSLAA